MKEPHNFKEFWDFYVSEHRRTETRVLHFVGSMIGLAILAGLIWSGNWYFFPLAFVPAYAFAWVSHFFVEHNTPATFKYPLWSFAGDWKMIWLMLNGKMPAEVRRVCGKKAV